MNRVLVVLPIALAFLSGMSFTSAALAQSWTEVGDAGDLPITAQTPIGSGALTTINGGLAFQNVDMYEIFITGGGTFSAIGVTGGPPLFLNPQLYLFDSEGRGVYANDDCFGCGSTALLPANHLLTPLTPGRYFLAVSTAHLSPISLSGLIFPCVGCSPGSVFGPIGPGGAEAVTGWSGFPFTAGTYRITLTGARFPPAADSTPPVVIPTVSGTLGLDGWYTSDVAVSWAVSDDESPISTQTGCTSSSVTSDTPSVTFTCTVASDGGTSSESVTIRRDATPPAISCSANPSVLWPPFGQLVAVQTFVSVNDVLSGPAGFVLDSVATSEGELVSNVVGWNLGSSDTSGFLRANRVGSNTGRFYTLIYMGADNAGNKASCDVAVSVPHDQGL